MEATRFQVPRQERQSIFAQYWELSGFYRPFHYHQECQMTLILASSGTFYTGNSSIPYEPGSLFLIGKNVPHVFREVLSPDTSSHPYPVQAISVFFDCEKFRNMLDHLAESSAVITLIDNCRYGIKVSLDLSSEIVDNISGLVDLKGLQQVLGLLNVLVLVGRQQDLEFVSTDSIAVKDPLDGKRIGIVLEYIQRNYSKQIALEDVAAQVNMTPSAFCRFFKKKTNTTLSHYLIETRISKACELLTQDDYTVSESCFESGYNSTSNFHRHFKRVTGFSPKEYKKMILTGA